MGEAQLLSKHVLVSLPAKSREVDMKDAGSPGVSGSHESPRRGAASGSGEGDLVLALQAFLHTTLSAPEHGGFWPHFWVRIWPPPPVLFKTFHLFRDLVLFFFSYLFIGSTQYQEGRNKELSSVLKATEVGPQYPFASVVPAWQTVSVPWDQVSFFIVVEILRWRAPLGEKDGLSKSCPSLSVYDLCWEFIWYGDKREPVLWATRVFRSRVQGSQRDSCLGSSQEFLPESLHQKGHIRIHSNVFSLLIWGFGWGSTNQKQRFPCILELESGGVVHQLTKWRAAAGLSLQACWFHPGQALA